MEKIQLSLKYDKNNGSVHEDRYTFLIISRSLILTVRNVSDKNCEKKIKTHFVFNNYFSKILPFMRQCGKIL